MTNPLNDIPQAAPFGGIEFPDETWTEVGYYDAFGACLLRGREAFDGEMLSLIGEGGHAPALKVIWDVRSVARKVVPL